MRYQVSSLVAFTFVLGCSASESSGEAGGGDTVAGADGSDGTDATDGADGTDGAAQCPPQGAACSPFCEPSGCADGQFCTLSGDAFVCAEVGPQAVGKPCGEGVPGCGAGACIQTESEGSRCLPFCQDEEGCADGETCNVVVPLGASEVRFCGPKPPGCDLFAQDCAEAGKGCYLGEDEAICLDAGEGKVGEACKGGDDCAAGMLCIDAKCLEICNPNTSGPQPRCSTKCPGRDAGIEGEKGVAVCTLKDETPPCDLLGGDCEAGKACYITIDGPRCRDAGTVAVGESCGSDQDCAPASTCVGSRCKALCDPNEGTHAQCEDTLTKCPPLSGQEVGYCDE